MGEEFKCFRLDGDDEGVAVFTMDRPSARNALGRQMMKEMREALQWAESSSEVRVVVLESAVERVFCAGADLKERATMTPEEAQAFVKGLRDGFSALAAARMPTIAAIEGAALGGGLELAMSCDLRVAGDAAMVGLPETGLAIIPGAGGTQRLPRLVGQARAKELIFTGRRVGAEEALQLGIVEFAVEKGAARDRAVALARSMLDKGPVALGAAKSAIDGGAGLPIEQAMAKERAAYDIVLGTKDRLEGLAAFKEKRKPVYRGE